MCYKQLPEGQQKFFQLEDKQKTEQFLLKIAARRAAKQIFKLEY